MTNINKIEQQNIYHDSYIAGLKVTVATLKEQILKLENRLTNNVKDYVVVRKLDRIASSLESRK